MQMESWLHAFGQFFTDKIIENFHLVGEYHGSLKTEVESPFTMLLSMVMKKLKAIMEMVKQMDAGDMIAARSLPILDEDNVGTLFWKILSLDVDLLSGYHAIWQGRSSQVHKIQIWSHFLPIFAEEEVLTDQNQPQVQSDLRMNPLPYNVNGQFLKSTKQSYCEGNETWRSDWFEQKSHGSCWRRFELSLKVVQPAENQMSITDLWMARVSFTEMETFGSNKWMREQIVRVLEGLWTRADLFWKRARTFPSFRMAIEASCLRYRHGKITPEWYLSTWSKIGQNWSMGLLSL